MSESTSLDVALRECLARTCAATDHELGQAWMPSHRQAEALCCRVSWASDVALEPFIAASEELRLDFSKGLPGCVWTSRRPVWVSDVQASELITRKEAAALVGLRSGAAAPVLAGGQPVAMLEFFTREPRQQCGETTRLLTGVAGHIGPIVQLKESQERLADSEARFRALAETAVDAIVSADRRGRTVYLNPQAQRMFGYAEREALGEPFTLLLPERHRAEQARLFERLARGDGSGFAGRTFELTGLRADGTEFPVELSLAAHGEVGGPAFVTGIIRDTTERRRAEEHLRQREAQLAEAQALARLGSWEWDLRSGEEQWSEEMYRIYGVAPQGPPPPRELIRYRDPHDTDALRTTWERAVKEARPFSLFHRIVRPDGRELTLHVRGKPTFDPDGNVAGIVGTTQDLTEQLQMEEKRRRAEERFRQAFENAPIGMVLARADGSISRVNGALCRMTGYRASELEGKQFRELAHPDDGEASERALTQLLRGERRAVHLEKRYNHASGGYIDARTSVSVVLDAEGEPSMVIAQIEDVTAAKRAQRAFEQTRERYQAILDSAPMAVTLKDRDGRYMLVNTMTARLAGMEPEEIIGRRTVELPSDGEEVELDVAADEDVLSRGEQVSFEHELDTPEGPRTLLTEKFPVRDGAGAIYAVAGVSVDISDRVRVERENRRLYSELQEARRLETVGGLAGGIAHDFNNLLAVIVNYAALAREEVPDASTVADELDEIRRAAERAADLTHKLLVFSRQEPLAPRVIDLNSVVAATDWLLRRTLGEDIELWVELVEDLWPVEGDAVQLEGILMNLAVNAAQAMPHGGTLSIRTDNVTLDGSEPPAARPGRYVRLSVSDTGSGMDEDVAARAFDPFFTTKPTGEGTGLGLATVQGVARQAGGTVELSSRPGGGTTVTVHLPASERELTPSPPDPAPEAARGDGQAILVVEDEASVRRMICRILTRAGYLVTEAAPMEALEACARPDKRVDLLLTDVVMPSISGGKLAVRARELCPDLRVLFMSGYVDEAKLESRTYELQPFLQKPFSPAELLHAIKRAIEQDAVAERSG